MCSSGRVVSQIPVYLRYGISEIRYLSDQLSGRIFSSDKLEKAYFSSIQHGRQRQLQCRQCQILTQFFEALSVVPNYYRHNRTVRYPPSKFSINSTSSILKRIDSLVLNIKIKNCQSYILFPSAVFSFLNIPFVTVIF